MHINEMLNKKTYIGNIEPNPKEFGIWIKEDGTHMIYDYTNNQWVCECSGSSKVQYYKVAAGTNLRDGFGFVAGIKIFDTSESKFEYASPITINDESYLAALAPNFSFETDEYCIAYLPIIMHLEQGENKLNVVCNTFEDIYTASGQEIPTGITRITEEEYWDDSVPNPTFTIGVYEMYITTNPTSNFNWVIAEYEYEPDMTFEDWINSKYNVDKIRISATSRNYVDFYYPKYDFTGADKFNEGYLTFRNRNGEIQLNSLMSDIIAHPEDSENGVTLAVTSGYRIAE